MTHLITVPRTRKTLLVATFMLSLVLSSAVPSTTHAALNEGGLIDILQSAAEKEKESDKQEKETKKEDVKEEKKEKKEEADKNMATTTSATSTSASSTNSGSSSSSSPQLPATGGVESPAATSSPAATTSSDSVATSTAVGAIIGQIKDKLTPSFLKPDKKPTATATTTASQAALAASTVDTVNPLKDAWSSVFSQNVYEMDSFSPETTRALNTTALTLAILGFILLSGVPQSLYERSVEYRGVGQGKTIARTRA